MEFLCDEEGLKADHELMDLWLDSAPALHAGAREPADRAAASADQYEYLRTVTWYVNPDQLSVLTAGAIYYSRPDDINPLDRSVRLGLHAADRPVRRLGRAASAHRRHWIRLRGPTWTAARWRSRSPSPCSSCWRSGRPIRGVRCTTGSWTRCCGPGEARWLRGGRQRPGAPAPQRPLEARPRPSGYASGSSAWSRSAMRSAGSSRPTDSPEKPSPA